jgi:hypothetical protein
MPQRVAVRSARGRKASLKILHEVWPVVIATEFGGEDEIKGSPRAEEEHQEEYA